MVGVSVEKARILAKTIGDGCLTNKYLRYNNKSPVLLKEFKEDIEKEYNIKIVTQGHSGSTSTPFLQTQIKSVIKDLFLYLNSFKSADVMIPECILNAKKQIKREFLRTIFDDEGSAALRYFNKDDEWKRDIHICSKSSRLIEEIKQILEKDFGIKCGKIIYSACVWVLYIYGKENIKKYQESIGFKHPRKKQLLTLMIKSYGNTKKRNPLGWNSVYSEFSGLKTRSAGTYASCL